MIERTPLTRIARTAFATLTALILTGVVTMAQDSPLVWRGCGITEKAFMGACVEVYEEETGQRIVLSAAGAALGIRSAAGKSADLGGTCRHCMTDEFESERGVKLAIVAWDALVAVTHPSNPVKDLGLAQLAGILRGEITNWNEVGGPDQRIIVVGRRSTDSGVGVMARLLVLKDPTFQYPRNSVLLRSSGPVEKFVEKTPGAIAITGVSSARKRALEILTLDGVLPDAEFIATGAYPYFRPLYIAFRPDSDERVHRFVRWLQDDLGQKTIAAQGTVTLEMGLPLVTKFTDWSSPEDITNLEALQARSREQARRNRKGGSGGSHL